MEPTTPSVTDEGPALHTRVMASADVGRLPIDCQGTADEVRARIADLGSSAMLVFDGRQHVGQLQFRRYDPTLRSPNGIMDPLYWGDFNEVERPPLPPRTINLFCYHVGQLASGQERDPRYHGRGIGVDLLRELIGVSPRTICNTIDDAHLAGVAISRGATLASFDSGFACFVGSGLRWERLGAGVTSA